MGSLHPYSESPAKHWDIKSELGHFSLELRSEYIRDFVTVWICRVRNPFPALFHDLCLCAERRVLLPSDCVYSESLTPQGKLVACRRDLTEILVRPTLLFCLVPLSALWRIYYFSQALIEAKDAGYRLKAPLRDVIILAFVSFIYLLLESGPD